ARPRAATTARSGSRAARRGARTAGRSRPELALSCAECYNRLPVSVLRAMSASREAFQGVFCHTRTGQHRKCHTRERISSYGRFAIEGHTGRSAAQGEQAHADEAEQGQAGSETASEDSQQGGVNEAEEEARHPE